ncbi:MAG: hypothetical protein AAFZ52_01440, partial [Bacteroidota bacterium]
MRTLVTLLLLSLLGTCGRAQTSLGPGDVAFTMINTDGDDAFAFILLKDVVAGTPFDVTDREYKNGSLNTGEGTVRITFTQASSCGSEYLFTGPAANYTGGRVNGTGQASIANVEGTMSLTTGGDGLIAFQGGTFITILQKCGFGFGNGDSQCSDLPPGLTAGQNALAYTNSQTGDLGEPDNIKYDCSPTTGTPTQLSAALATNSNWLEDNTNPFSYGSGCSFTCLAGCIDPVLTGLTTNPTSSCPGTPVTININGSLNDAPEWELRQGGCTGPVLAVSTTNFFTVNPGPTTPYSVTALDCNNQRVCRSVTVTRSVQAADAGPDKLLTVSPTTLAANSAGTGTGTWTIVSGTGGSFDNPSSPTSSFSGVNGAAYVLRWTVSGGGCPTTFDEVEVSFFGGTTDLVAGDVAFTGYNSVAPDEWSFVLLREITAGTQILFTDNGWLASGGFRSGEGAVNLVFNRPYPCGASVLVTRDNTTSPYRAVDDNGAVAAQVATLSATGNVIPNLATTGDQLFAFQGAYNAPNLLAGIMVGEAWNADATSNTTSAQPPALSGNNTAVNLTTDVNNGKYGCAVTAGVPAAIRTAVNNASNWTTSDNFLTLQPACGFVCGSCEEPVITGLSASPDPVCQGAPVTLTISGDLNEASRWAVYATNCGVDEVASSTTNTVTFTPDATGTYFVAGVDGCVATPVCTSLNISVASQQADVARDLVVTPLGTTSATIQPAPPSNGQTASLEFISGDGQGIISGPTASNVWTITGTSGRDYRLRYSHLGGSCPTTTDEVTIVFSGNTPLTAGGIAFTGINTRAPDGFSFVALRDINAGTKINFTDRGWNAGFISPTTESTMEMELLTYLSCGEGIYLESGTADNLIANWTVRRVNGGTLAGRLAQVGPVDVFQLATSGDQVFAYQGAEPQGENDGNFLAGISTNIASAG